MTTIFSSFPIQSKFVVSQRRHLFSHIHVYYCSLTAGGFAGLFIVNNWFFASPYNWTGGSWFSKVCLEMFRRLFEMLGLFCWWFKRKDHKIVCNLYVINLIFNYAVRAILSFTQLFFLQIAGLQPKDNL